MAVSKKTKRFLFFTGGTDSVLLLHYMLELLSKNRNDELVVTMVANTGMRSGQEEAIEEAVGLLIHNLVEKKLHLSKKILDQISVIIMNQGVSTQSTIDAKGTARTGEEFDISLKTATQDPEFAKNMKSIVAQEIVVLSAVPSMIGYLGSCRNVFYIGACGSDIATRGTAKLRQLFDLNFEIAMQTSDSNGLELDLKKSGIKPYGRFEGKFVNKDWIPTLEFPLQDMRKQDVVMMLDVLGSTAYKVDKPENLIEHYAAMDGSEMYVMTKVYHNFKLMYDHPSDFPSLLKFIKEDKLEFTLNGEPASVAEEDIMNAILEEKINLLGRATGMGSNISAMLKKFAGQI